VLITLKANYNVITDSGSKEDKTIVKHKLYYHDGSKLIKIEKSKKKVIALFNKYTDETKKFIHTKML